MRIPLRAARRLAVTGWFALSGVLLVVAQGRAATPPEKVLPDSTIAFVKIQNSAALREAFLQSQLGQLWNDPEVKAWKDDLLERLDKESQSLKEQVGVTFRELLALPQGPAAIALLKHDNPEIPFTLLIIADAGKNTGAMNGVLTRATKQGEANGSKVSTEAFHGQTIHVIQPPKDKAKDKDKDKDKKDQPDPPIVWSSQGSVFYIGSDVEAMKDILAHDQGRNNSLADTESYAQAVRKLGSDLPVFWFVDLPKVLKMLAQAGATANANGNGGGGPDPNQAQQIDNMIQLTGLNGLRAATGSFTLNTGKFDSVTKIMFLVKGPPVGLLKVFRLPRLNLEPEPWVPASVASYQTVSWDLDNAFVAINELANQFQPGLLDTLQQQFVLPEGGEPLKFKQDIFDPLGDRITIISDFKKPVKDDSERMLLAVALEDAKTFQSTLQKLIALTSGQPKKREFLGSTIYDFAVQQTANPNGGAGAANDLKPKGPISVTIAKNTLFVSSEPTLLELVLRGGGPTLADSESYKAVAGAIPRPVSSMSYVRPDEQARLTYDMVKSGQFQKALEAAPVASGPDLSRLARIIDKDKVPDFSVFAKYLAPGGRFSISTEDGLTITAFSLRKLNP